MDVSHINAKEFGRILKKLRGEKGLTLKELEQKSGYSNSYLSQIENGHKGMPNDNDKFIYKIANGLDINPVYFRKLLGMHSKEREITIDSNSKNIEFMVSIPMKSISTENTGTENLSEEEMNTMLFDLNKYLQWDIDIFYKNNRLTDKDKQSLLKIIDIYLNKDSD